MLQYYKRTPPAKSCKKGKKILKKFLVGLKKPPKKLNFEWQKLQQKKLKKDPAKVGFFLVFKNLLFV